MNEREAVETQPSKQGEARALNEAGTAQLLTPIEMRVLVVEDDLALQEAIVDTLELADFIVLAAASAAHAGRGDVRGQL